MYSSNRRSTVNPIFLSITYSGPKMNSNWKAIASGNSVIIRQNDDVIFSKS